MRDVALLGEEDDMVSEHGRKRMCRLRPVACYCAEVSAAERNSLESDKELLAIVRSVDKWRCHSEGSSHPVHDVCTDHRGLECVNSERQLTGRLTRGMLGSRSPISRTACATSRVR